MVGGGISLTLTVLLILSRNALFMKWCSASTIMPADRELVDPLLVLDLYSRVGNGFGSTNFSSCGRTGVGFPFGLEKV